MSWLIIKTATELVRVQAEDVVYVKADGNYSEMLLYNGSKHTMTFQLHHFENVFQRLKNNSFVRVGRSVIVNKNYIFVINLTEQKIVLNGGKLGKEYLLSASKDALKELKLELGEANPSPGQKGGHA